MSEPDITLAKIELPVAPKDAARVIDAVVDLFSPITEAMGALGDHVRIYRTNSVLRTLRESKRIANEAGYRLKTPPLKFLVPYLEEASLHDESEEPALTALWANLLVQAGQDGDKANRMMVDLLARLSPRDAESLEQVVRNPRWCGRPVNCIVDAAFEFERFNLGELLNNTLGKVGESEALESIIHEIEDRGVIVVACGFYSIGEADDNQWDEAVSHPDFPNEDDLSLHTLAALGLVKFPIVAGRPYRGGMFSMTICVLTAMGAEFFLSTHNPILREHGSTIDQYEGPISR